MSFDVRCYDLACIFLKDAHLMTEPRATELAQNIQDGIENFIECAEEEVTANSQFGVGD